MQICFPTVAAVFIMKDLEIIFSIRITCEIANSLCQEEKNVGCQT